MEPKDKLARLESDRLQAPGIQPSTASMPSQYGGTLEFEQVHLRDYLRVLRKYRLTILLFVLTTVLTVLLVSLRMTKKYEAVVRVAIDRENPSALMKESTVPSDPWSFQDYLRTQIRVLESDTMAMLTIRALRLDRELEFRSPKEEGAQAAGPLPVETPIDPSDETRLIRQFQGNLPEDERRAFVFTNVVDGSGRKYDMPVVVGALSASPRIYAVGECAEHRGIAYGLVAPLYEQGAVLAKHLAGVETEGYAGSVTSTKLKVSGVDVFSAGQFDEAPGTRSLKIQDDVAGTYKKIVIQDGKLVGLVTESDFIDVSSRLLDEWLRQE